MIKCAVLKNGALKVTAGNQTRKLIKELQNQATGRVWNYWEIMQALFEGYACDSSFTHFDAGQANPFVGLTDAPCIAESMLVNDVEGYVLNEQAKISEVMQGDNDHQLGFMQRAYYLQEGEMLALLPK